MNQNINISNEKNRIYPKFFLAYAIPSSSGCKGKEFPWERTGINMDGVLISRAYVKPKLEERLKHIGIRKFLRWDGKLIGDCGAFDYKFEEEPPYKPKDILDYYISSGFNVGAHLDHLILNSIRVDGKNIELSLNEKRKRWEISLFNAKECIELLNKEKYNDLEIMGISHGWNVSSYRACSRELLKMGYTHIGIGSLVKRPTTMIKKIFQSVYEETIRFKKKNIKIHAFGIGRMSLIDSMCNHGITSFDTASPYRRAWLSSDVNYFMRNPWRGYSAIRIRISGKKIELKEFEEKALLLFRNYCNHETEDIDSVINTILIYEKKWLLFDGVKNKTVENLIKKRKEKYYKTLEDRPWEKCECKMCKERKENVILFRRGWRNGSRASHNLYHFYREFQHRLNNVKEIDNIQIQKTLSEYPN